MPAPPGGYGAPEKSLRVRSGGNFWGGSPVVPSKSSESVLGIQRPSGALEKT